MDPIPFIRSWCAASAAPIFIELPLDAEPMSLVLDLQMSGSLIAEEELSCAKTSAVSKTVTTTVARAIFGVM
jgi:hypothetical protein